MHDCCQACGCCVQEQQAPFLARANHSSIADHHDTAQPSSEIESLVDLTDSAPPTADYSTAVKSFNRTASPAGVVRGVGVDAVVTADPVLEVSRANSKAGLEPSFGSSSPLLPADAHSSFQVPSQLQSCLLLCWHGLHTSQCCVYTLEGLSLLHGHCTLEHLYLQAQCSKCAVVSHMVYVHWHWHTVTSDVLGCSDWMLPVFWQSRMRDQYVIV